MIFIFVIKNKICVYKMTSVKLDIKVLCVKNVTLLINTIILNICNVISVTNKIT